jgi:lipopolysaccharide export LptBFGC system permease protein LptF
MLWGILFTVCGYNLYMRVKGDFLTADYIYGIIRTQGFDAKKYLAYIYRKIFIADFIVVLPTLIAGLTLGNGENTKPAVGILAVMLVTIAVLYGIFHYRIYENGNAITTGMIEVLRLAYHLLVEILLLAVFVSLFFTLFDFG